MAVIRCDTRWKITTCILDHDIDVSLRLRLAMGSVKEFGHSALCQTISEARRALGEDSWDVIFLTYTFPPNELTAFIDEARASSGGRNAAFVLVVQQHGKQTQELAAELLRGVDGILSEPFSFFELAEVVTIAERVRRGRKLVREAIALKLLVPSIVRAFEVWSFLEVNGYDTEYTRTKLAEVRAAISEFLPESQRLYLDLLTFRFEVAPLPRVSSHQRYEGASKAVKRRFERFLLRDLARVADKARFFLS